VLVGVFEARAAKSDRRKGVESELARVEAFMLAGEDEARGYAARFERSGNGPQFDGFRSGPDDQPDVGETQPSP
jgi:hypothetical protein